MKYLRWTALVLGMGAAGCALHPTFDVEDPRQIPPPPAVYRLEAGDRITVRDWNEARLATTDMVRSDGRISLPLLGDVDVSGRTLGEMETELTQRYRKLDARATPSVQLAAPRLLKYYILGEVAHGGEFTLDKPITMLQAVARAGGLSPFAQGEWIQVRRRNEGNEKRCVVRIRFDYARAVADPEYLDFEVRDNDVIWVP